MDLQTKQMAFFLIIKQTWTMRQPTP